MNSKSSLILVGKTCSVAMLFRVQVKERKRLKKRVRVCVFETVPTFDNIIAPRIPGWNGLWNKRVVSRDCHSLGSQHWEHPALFGAKSARERFFSFEKLDMANGETYLCHHDKDEREENKCSLTLDHHRSRSGCSWAIAMCVAFLCYRDWQKRTAFDSWA
jgi:hypothetical protein